MREGFGKDFWKRQLEEGVDATPDDLEAVIPEYLKGRSVEDLATELATPDMFPLTEHPSKDMKATLVRDPKGEKVKKELPSRLFSMAAALAASHMAPPPEMPAQHIHTIEAAGKAEYAEVKLDDTFPSHKLRVKTGELAGHKVNDLFADYLGLKRNSIVPEEIEVDFGRNLEVLWQHKIEFMDREINKVERVHKKKVAELELSGDTDKIKKENASYEKKMKDLKDRRANVLKAKGEVVSAYAERWNNEEVTHMTLEDLSVLGDDVTTKINSSLDWEKMNARQGPFPRLSDDAVQLFAKPLAERVTGNMLVAYSATELMPSVHKNEFNMAEYQFLIKHAGVEYVLSLPAVHDHWLSFGMLQFTSLALREDEEKTEGASRVNNLLPEEEQISGSVKYVNTVEGQLKAGHMFAIYNITNLIQHILKDDNHERKIRRLGVLYKRTPQLEAELLEFIACAHHNPKGAITAFEKWLDVGLDGGYKVHMNKVLGEYAQKSYGNYKVQVTYGKGKKANETS